VARRALFVGPAQAIDRRILVEHGLVNPDAGVDALGEEFRLIKRQLMRSTTADPRGHRVLVTSAQPDEGKTFTALNLALSLAQDQERSVLLVDGDFARGDVARRLGISSQYGLMDALTDPAIDIAQCIVPTDIGNLAILPAGAASTRDTELLGSARMLEILNRLQGDAPDRVLIFDSTPLLAASSAGVIASLCGQVLVVVRAEVTREAALRDAIGLIGQHNGISLLLNRVRFTPEGRRFGSYYGEGG
jgi:protein-tyrosine kinase